MRFPQELKSNAHQSVNGEYAWRRHDALRAVRLVAAAGLGVLGGELWLICGTDVYALLPTKRGPAHFGWTCGRQVGESWDDFVERSLADGLKAIRTLPEPGIVEMPAGCGIFYNLTWVDEAQHDSLRTGT